MQHVQAFGVIMSSTFLLLATAVLISTSSGEDPAQVEVTATHVETMAQLESVQSDLKAVDLVALKRLIEAEAARKAALSAEVEAPLAPVDGVEGQEVVSAQVK